MKKTQINENFFRAHIVDESILLNCLHYPKQSIDSMQYLPKFLWFFQRNRTDNTKIYENTHTQRAKAVLRKKDKPGDTTLPDFIMYYKAIGTKTVWC